MTKTKTAKTSKTTKTTKPRAHASETKRLTNLMDQAAARGDRAEVKRLAALLGTPKGKVFGLEGLKARFETTGPQGPVSKKLPPVREAVRQALGLEALGRQLEALSKLSSPELFEMAGKSKDRAERNAINLVLEARAEEQGIDTSDAPAPKKRNWVDTGIAIAEGPKAKPVQKPVAKVQPSDSAVNGEDVLDAVKNGKAPKQGNTLRALYLQWLAGTSKQHSTTYANTLRRPVGDFIDWCAKRAFAVPTIDTKALARYRAHAEGQGAAISTTRMNLARVQTFLRFAGCEADLSVLRIAHTPKEKKHLAALAAARTVAA